MSFFTQVHNQVQPEAKMLFQNRQFVLIHFLKELVIIVLLKNTRSCSSDKTLVVLYTININFHVQPIVSVQLCRVIFLVGFMMGTR